MQLQLELLQKPNRRKLRIFLVGLRHCLQSIKSTRYTPATMASTSIFKACSKCLLGRGNAQSKFWFCVECCASHVVSGEPQTKCVVKTHNKKRTSTMLVAPDNEQRTEVEDGEEEVMEKEQGGEENDGT